MVRSKSTIRSNILKTIKANNKAFSRNQEPSRGSTKLQYDRGLQGAPMKGQASPEQPIFAGILPAEPGKALTATAWWNH